MSAANVEIAKGALDAFNRRDVAALLDLVTADIEWFPAMAMAVEGGSYRGREGIERYLAEVRDTWEEVRVLGGEFRDLGDRVLVLGRAEGRGTASGVPVAAPQGVICDFRSGRISRVRSYLDHGEALRAAGLCE